MSDELTALRSQVRHYRVCLEAVAHFWYNDPLAFGDGATPTTLAGRFADIARLCIGALESTDPPTAPAPPAADRELLAARQLIRLLTDTLRERGEHTAACERAIVAGGECGCGLDLAIALATDSGAVPDLPIEVQP